jgi:hypothetical protein
MNRPRGIARAFLLALTLGAIAGGRPLRAGDDAKTTEKIISAAEVRNHVGKAVTAELMVKASKNAVPRRTYFLDSEEDFHDEKNLSVVVSYDHAGKFHEAGIDDPSEYYKGKTIRVTGKVIEEDNQVRIRVEDPKQIKLVD